jgi:hypothetical protein
MIQTVQVSDQTFDDALERFAWVGEQLVSRVSMGRVLERKEILDRYAFTSLCEALRSEEFDEDPLETVLDLELEAVFTDEDDAWEAIKAFYSSRGCVLLHVGDAEEFIVGQEILITLGLL